VAAKRTESARPGTCAGAFGHLRHESNAGNHRPDQPRESVRTRTAPKNRIEVVHARTQHHQDRKYAEGFYMCHYNFLECVEWWVESAICLIMFT
ncbi:MAG: hypothetical protein KAI76_02325, partial [Alphaproteobacteria bacterium]|nr:hypothetical protein [Alphaproteobacteria bacterium]